MTSIESHSWHLSRVRVGREAKERVGAGLKAGFDAFGSTLSAKATANVNVGAVPLHGPVDAVYVETLPLGRCGAARERAWFCGPLLPALQARREQHLGVVGEAAGAKDARRVLRSCTAPWRGRLTSPRAEPPSRPALALQARRNAGAARRRSGLDALDVEGSHRHGRDSVRVSCVLIV